MTLQLQNRQIKRVQIIDDDPVARESYGDAVEELSLEPIIENGPLRDIEFFTKELLTKADAAICDHHLKKKNYATFNGAQTVARLYSANFPAILCTKYESSDIYEIRPFRQRIPVLLKPSELDPSSVEKGFKRCVDEFNGFFQVSRRPWRTLIRVDRIDEERGLFYVIVPVWNAESAVSLRLSDVPSEIKERILNGQERFHAKVNIGAEDINHLYFYDWEEE